MSPRYLRRQPGPRENAAAGVLSGVLAAGVGLVVFYLTRLLLARDAVGDDSDPVLRDGGGSDE